MANLLQWDSSPVIRWSVPSCTQQDGVPGPDGDAGRPWTCLLHEHTKSTLTYRAFPPAEELQATEQLLHTEHRPQREGQESQRHGKEGNPIPALGAAVGRNSIEEHWAPDRKGHLEYKETSPRSLPNCRGRRGKGAAGTLPGLEGLKGITVSAPLHLESSPGQWSLQLKASCQGDTGAKHHGILQACTTLALQGMPGCPQHRVTQHIPGCAHLGSRQLTRVSYVVEQPRNPEPLHAADRTLCREPCLAPTSASALLPGCPLCGGAQDCPPAPTSAPAFLPGHSRQRAQNRLGLRRQRHISRQRCPSLKCPEVPRPAEPKLQRA